MKDNSNNQKKWHKPEIFDIALEFDKDVIAKCHTLSGGNAAMNEDTGCQVPQNRKCN